MVSSTAAEANRRAAAAIVAARPVLTDIRPAREVIPDLDNGVLLHAGPPVTWENMLGVQRGAVVGAMIYEGWAQSAVEAEARAAEGHVRFVPCNDMGAVGGLSGVTSPSMPVAVVRNSAGKEVAFSRLWEPHLHIGAFTPEAMRGLQRLERVFAPALAEAIHKAGGVDLHALIAEALHMGDECHSRVTGGSSLFLRRLLPHLLASDTPAENAVETARWLAANDAAVLPFYMAAAKVIAMAASNVPGSSVVTVICGNGVDMGIKLSGTGERWFTAPAPAVEVRLQPGSDPADIAPYVGDSTIIELAGLGACAMAAAPNSLANVGGGLSSALDLTKTALRSAVSRNPAWTLPALNFAGTAAGLDARAMVETGSLPPLAATAVSRRAGGGRAGAGIVYPPVQALEAAVKALAG